MSIVPRARWVHQARASAPPNACVISREARAAWSAMIFPGNALIASDQSAVGGAAVRGVRGTGRLTQALRRVPDRAPLDRGGQPLVRGRDPTRIPPRERSGRG